MKKHLLISVRRVMPAAVLAMTLVATRTGAENNTTNFLYDDGGTHNLTGDLTVGNSGTNNYGEVSNATTVNNTGNAQISYGGAAMHNLAVVSGGGSSWNPSGYMIVGYFGTDARLIITNGGSVHSTLGGLIGYYYDYVSNNVVEVTGTGSKWTMGGQLWVGGNGWANQLLISDGATVTNTGSTFIGLAAATSSNNLMSITGSGSVFSNGGDLIFGNGSHNSFVIANGGLFVGPNIREGLAGGSYNQLLITNGGVARTSSGSVGESGGGSNNTALVSGPGSIWTNSSALTIGGAVRDNLLTVSEGGKVYSGSAVIGSSGSSGNGNTALITGSGSLWQNAGDFTIGNGTSNRLIVTDGASVISPNFRIGLSTGGYNELIVTNGGYAQTIGVNLGESGLGPGHNAIRVSGAGSVYTNTSTGIYGLRSSNNTVTVSDGGKLYNGGDTFIGGHFGAFGAQTEILVTGPGSLWQSSGANTYLGFEGTANSITVADGGEFRALGTVWNNTGSNSVLVTDAGSLFSVADLKFNRGGAANELVVSNGARMVTAAARIGEFGSFGRISVTGPGSSWTNTGAGVLFIGQTGQGNELRVEDGGQVVLSAGTSLGSSLSSSNNLLLVTGSGSLYVNNGDFSLSGGGHHSVIVADGGKLISPNLRAFGTPNNLILVTNGGFAQTLSVALGESSAAATGNRLIVSGAGSILTNTGAGQTLRVGLAAGDAEVRVEDGGRIYNTADVTVGGYFGLTTHSNTVSVAGAGSQLNIGGTLFFGWGGAAGVPTTYNELLISDGGQVNVAGTVYLAYTEANSNTVVVTGAGSALNQSGSDFVPNRTGSGNTLLIADGGTVRSTNGRIGNGGGSNGLVTVTGSGSVWTNVGGVTVGDASIAVNHTLVVEDNAELYGTVLRAGNLSSTGNKVRVTSGGMVQANTMIVDSAAGNSISNVGGIYQFSTAAPTVTPNGVGRISLTDGTVSYAGVASADINHAQVGNMSKNGNNAFRLNNSTNAAVSYTFDSVANTGNPTNYQRLVLQNNARWQGINLAVGTGGGLKAGAGDVVQVSGNFSIFDANNYDQSFDLASATVLFSGGGNQTNAITGTDLGHDGLLGYADGFTAFNYSYGTLRLGSASDHIYFTSGDGALSNALYVLNLDLGGNTNLVANLHAPGSINIYYGISTLSPGNAYLNDLVYNLSGGGLLLPAIPEPSTAALLLSALGALAFRRRSAGASA